MSLSKLKNKYFATRCLQGHVNIFSATNHPDRLFTIENVDRDDASVNQEQSMNQTYTMNNTMTAQQENTYNQSLSNMPIPSEKDKMIELKWKQTLQTSSTVLCFSNYNQQQVIVATVDLKTRRKNIVKTLKNQQKPTFLYQIDENYLLVGTEKGFIEYWALSGQSSEQLVSVIEAHPESEEGISSLIELKSKSDLMWGYDMDSEERKDTSIYRLFATAAYSSNIIRLWILQVKNQNFMSHIKIETSMN